MAYSHDTNCISPKMTAANTPAPNVISESNYSGGNAGWKAFKQLDNGDPWWFNSTAAPQWIKLDFGAGNAVMANCYTLSSTPNNGTYPGMPVAWTVEGSNDNSEWTELDSRSSILPWGGSTMRKYGMVNVTAYRYYRFTFTQKEGSGFGWQVDEIELVAEAAAVARIAQTVLEVLVDEAGADNWWPFFIRYYDIHRSKSGRK